MWLSGEVDAVNNNERLIVSAEDVNGDPGKWAVRVWSKRLVGSDSQNYSLVVTGAIEPPTGNGGDIAEDIPVSSSSATDEVARGNEDGTSSGRRSASLSGGECIALVPIAVAVAVASAAALAAGVPPSSMGCLASLM